VITYRVNGAQKVTVASGFTHLALLRLGAHAPLQSAPRDGY
jgi:hypothetical protein